MFQPLLTRLKPYWQPESGIFLFFWVYLLVAGQSRLFQDPGTFWHTIVGQQIESDLGWPLRLLYLLLLFSSLAGLAAWSILGGAYPVGPASRAGLEYRSASGEECRSARGTYSAAEECRSARGTYSSEDSELYGLLALVDGFVIVLILVSAGSLIVHLGSAKLIFSDTFSFTFASRPWIPHQWLGECLLAAVHRFDGLDSLLLATVTILASLYTWVALRLIRSGLHWSLAVLVVFLAVAASASHFHIRPHLSTIVFLALTQAFLIDFEAGRIGPARLAWLVPIYLVWTNMHGGTLGGLATLALALAGWSAYRLLGWASPLTSIRQFLAVAVLFAACAATVLINPYGLLMVRTWLDIVRSDVLPRIIVEHRPLSLTKLDGCLVVGLAGFYTVALLSTWPHPTLSPGGGGEGRVRGHWPRVTWLLPFAWLVQAGLHIRHAPLFAVAAALALADFLPYTRFANWARGTGSDLFMDPKTAAAEPRHSLPDWRPALLPILLVGTAIVLQASGIEAPVIGHHWARLDPATWPVELLPELKRHEHDRPDGTPIFNDYLYGGYLIYHAPGYRVFVDDRCELYRDPADSYRDQWLDEFVDPFKVHGPLPASDHAAAERYYANGMRQFFAGRFPEAVRELLEAHRYSPRDTRILAALDLAARAKKIREWEQRYGLFPLALVQTCTPGEQVGYDDYFRDSKEWEVVKRTPTATLYRRKQNGPALIGD